MSYHEAYVHATKQTLEEKEMTQITASLLAALSLNRGLLHIWQAEYDYIQDALKCEEVDPVVTMLVKTVCDGLWFGALFPFEFMDKEEEMEIIDYLLERLREQK